MRRISMVRSLEDTSAQATNAFIREKGTYLCSEKFDIEAVKRLGYIIQVVVKTTPEADADIAELPVIIVSRLEAIIDRLERWPDVSGAKPLRGDWAGCYRIRTGDWRVLFRIAERTVIIVRVMHRSKVYED